MTLLKAPDVILDSTLTASHPRNFTDRSADTISIFDVIPYGIAQQVKSRTYTGDLSSYVSGAISDLSSAGGGNILFPNGTYKLNVTIKSGVTLTSQGFSPIFGYLPSNLGGVIFEPFDTSKFVIDSAAAVCAVSGVAGISFSGGGSGTSGGIRYDGTSNNTYWNVVKCCQFNNFGDQAIHLKGANVVATTLEDILVTTGLATRTRTARIGAIQVEGTDNYLNRVESGCGLSALQSASLWLAGIYFPSGGGSFANHFVMNCVGEASDVGIANETLLTRFTNSRADTNFGHGWLGSSAQFLNCTALDNSKAGDGLYNGFDTNAQQGGIYSGCFAYNSGILVRHNYGFFDGGAFGAESSRPQFHGCRSLGHKAGQFNGGAAGNQNPSFEVGTATLIGTGATPNIDGLSRYIPQDGGAITITNFTNGINGQSLKVFGNANVTIANNANIVTNTGANKTLQANKFYTFTLINAVWYENA